MAGADYRSCDVCGSKTFYDANLSYDWEEHEDRPFVRDTDYHLGYLGDWACICIGCAKTHRVVIEKIGDGK